MKVHQESKGISGNHSIYEGMAAAKTRESRMLLGKQGAKANTAGILGAYRTTRTNLALSVYFYTNLVSTLNRWNPRPG
jgi:hypothetical protein